LKKLKNLFAQMTPSFYEVKYTAMLFKMYLIIFFYKVKKIYQSKNI